MSIRETMHKIVSTTGTSAPVPSDSELDRAQRYVLAWLRRYHGYKGEFVKGLPNDEKECPVAKMLTQAHNRDYWVDGERYGWWSGLELPKPLPYWPETFVEYFDDGYYPELEEDTIGP